MIFLLFKVECSIHNHYCVSNVKLEILTRSSHHNTSTIETISPPRFVRIGHHASTHQETLIGVLGKVQYVRAPEASNSPNLEGAFNEYEGEAITGAVNENKQIAHSNQVREER